MIINLDKRVKVVLCIQKGWARVRVYTESDHKKGGVTKKEALALLREFSVPRHMIEHSRRVADIACFLTSELTKVGYMLDPSLVEAGSLLHDIAKAHSLKTGENHTSLGGKWLSERGLYKVADIVLYHVDLPDEEMKISEVAVVNYSDKRVMDTKLVSLQERFEGIVRRYGVDNRSMERINFVFQKIKRLEQILFTPLPFGAEELIVRMKDDRL